MAYWNAMDKSPLFPTLVNNYQHKEELDLEIHPR